MDALCNSQTCTCFIKCKPSTHLNSPCILFSFSAGLQEDYCVEKMRQLTIVSLAMEAREIPFSRLTQELSLEEDKLEQFVIDGELYAVTNKD